MDQINISKNKDSTDMICEDIKYFKPLYDIMKKDIIDAIEKKKTLKKATPRYGPTHQLEYSTQQGSIAKMFKDVASRRQEIENMVQRNIEDHDTADVIDNIDEITNTLEKPDTTTEIKELSLYKLDACQLDALHSITSPLNIPRFNELRDRYETCLNQIRTFLLQVESLRGKYLIHKLQMTINEIKSAVQKLKQKEKIWSLN